MKPLSSRQIRQPGQDPALISLTLFWTEHVYLRQNLLLYLYYTIYTIHLCWQVRAATLWASHTSNTGQVTMQQCVKLRFRVSYFYTITATIFFSFSNTHAILCKIDLKMTCRQTKQYQCFTTEFVDHVTDIKIVHTVRMVAFIWIYFI